MLTLRIFAFAIFSIQGIWCLHKVYCEIDDEDCVTNAVNMRVMPKLFAGVSGIDILEPLHLTSFEVNLPNLKVMLLNATMTGVRDCMIHVRKNSEDTLFEYRPCCPQLTIESMYMADGKIDAMSVKGMGILKLTYEDYNMEIIGNQEKVKYEDNKNHVRILNYTTQLDLKGKIAYDYTNLIFSAAGKCRCVAALRSKYLEKFEEITRKPIVEAFVNKMMENVRDFHTAIPVEELYYKYV